MICSQSKEEDAKLKKKCCKKDPKKAKKSDYEYTVHEIEEIDQHLFTRLALEKKA